ncbi:MAG: glycosyltransferase family 2 protein [Hyphomicrobiaceae bacterium]
MAAPVIASAGSVPPIPLSTLIRTKNHAGMIGQVIAAAGALGGEIVVIDSGSTDGTIEIAENAGARVVSNPWPGFGPQRRFGEEQCGHDMIFSLDADEIVTADMAREVRAHFVPGPPPRLMVVRKAMIMPHHDRPPPWGFAHEQVLIYDRRVARTSPNPNWDKLDITVKDKPVTIRAPLWHYSLEDWHQAVGKANYIAKLAADTMDKPRSRFGLLVRLVIEFPVTFLKFYFLRRYFLAGVEGFNMAVVTAFGRWLRIAMMLERHDWGGIRRKI